MSSSAGLVVVGASLAGLRAVEAARKAGYTGAITLIGAETELPYDRPPLSKQMLGVGTEVTDTTFRTEEHLRDDLGVELVLGRPATALDSGGRRVQIGDRWVDYDALVIATGAGARTLPGHEAEPRVVALRTVQDARRIREAMDEGQRILVVGCGFIGSEVSSAIVARGGTVTLVEMAPVPLVRAVGESAGAWFADLHRQQGVDLRLGCTVSEIKTPQHGLEVALSDGSTVEAGLVVLGLGAVPATGWLKGSGVALEADGSVAADATLRTTAPDVFAAGDVVTWDNALLGRRMRLEHWTSAAEQGAVAARNAIGPERTDYETVPYFWSDLYGRRVQFVGVHGVGAPRTFADATTRAVLYSTDDRLAGALLVSQPRLTMKLRRIVAEHGALGEAVDLVRSAGLGEA